MSFEVFNVLFFCAISLVFVVAQHWQNIKLLTSDFPKGFLKVIRCMHVYEHRKDCLCVFAHLWKCKHCGREKDTFSRNPNK